MLMMMKLPEWQAAIEEMADAAKGDELVKGSIIEMLAQAGLIEPPKKWEPPKPCPTAIAAAELSIFDNWAGKTKAPKNKPFRWAASLKVWGKGAKIDWKKPHFVATIQLFNAEEMTAKAVDLKRTSLMHPITAEYSGTMTDLIAPLMEEEGFRGGPIYTKQHGRGTFYHDHQLLLIDAKALNSRALKAATLILDAETRIALDGFSGRDAKGKRLSGNCVAQCRYIDPDDADLSKRLGGWSTRNLY